MPEENHRMKQESEPGWLRKVLPAMRDGAGTIFNKAFLCKQGNASGGVVSSSNPAHPSATLMGTNSSAPCVD